MPSDNKDYPEQDAFLEEIYQHWNELTDYGPANIRRKGVRRKVVGDKCT